jgi:hypothetical protein
MVPLTISSLTTTGATGTFSFNAIPNPGANGATGTKVVVNGAFTARF